MIRRPPRSTRTDTLFPYTTLFRSLVVAQRLQVRCAQDLAAGLLDDALPGGGIPLRGWTGARMQIGGTFGDLAELQRRANTARLMRRRPRQQRLQRRVAMRFADQPDRRRGRHPARADRIALRPEETPVGTGCVSTCSYRWLPYH